MKWVKTAKFKEAASHMTRGHSRHDFERLHQSLAAEGIVMNPTRQQLLNLMRKMQFKEVCGLATADGLFVSDQQYHHAIANAVGVPYLLDERMRFQLKHDGKIHVESDARNFGHPNVRTLELDRPVDWKDDTPLPPPEPPPGRRINVASAGHFLSNPKSAWEWAKENVADIAVEEDKGEDDPYVQMYRERAAAYVERFRDCMSRSGVEVYRAVKVAEPKAINWQNVGTHWSFERDGVGVYGQVPAEHQEGREIILTAMVNPQNIDWEYGFTSFMYYGEDQWECAVDKGSTVLVTAIDQQPVNIRGRA
jgi:hypothetical protein